MTILLLVFDQPATGLITVSSVVIAVIGFALRNVISDVFSGIALGVDHPYRIGDWIETTQGNSGKVSEITWRTTRLIDRNGFVIIVPNGLVAGQRLINYGDGERDYRTALRVPLDATVAGRAGETDTVVRCVGSRAGKSAAWRPMSCWRSTVTARRSISSDFAFPILAGKRPAATLWPSRVAACAALRRPDDTADRPERPDPGPVAICRGSPAGPG